MGLCSFFSLLFGYQGGIKGDVIIGKDAHSIGTKYDKV